MALWLKEGEDSDVVVSTRARLARNVEGLPFPAVIRNTPKAKQVTMPAIETFVDNADFKLINMSDIDVNERTRLKEDHIISNELAASKDGAVIVSPDESLSVMLMEEDDYRLQCILPGLQAEKALSMVRELDKMLGRNVKYAYDSELGFLTGCITNVGTGLRISAMLHLPALTMTGMMGRLITQIAKLGITVRGIYGEGSEAQGNLYQVSNQLTLGLSEDEIVSNVKSVVMNLITRERDMRNRLITEKGADMSDAIARALALLKFARKMDSKEALRLLSSVNIGVSAGIVSGITSTDIYNTMIAILPGNVSEKELNNFQSRDIKRASKLRMALKNAELTINEI